MPRSAPGSAITGRDFNRAEEAAADIRAISGNPAVDAFAADMTSRAEVRGLAGAVLDVYNLIRAAARAPEETVTFPCAAMGQGPCAD